MNGILNYQTTEFDCGTTSLINAFRFLYDRKELQPDLLKGIYLYTLDTFNEQGEAGKHGTSRAAMRFLSEWLNTYASVRQFPIEICYLSGKAVSFNNPDSEILDGLSNGGAVVIRCHLAGDEHYVLLTGLDGEEVALFDPYELDASYFETICSSKDGVRFIDDEPRRCNRKVQRWVFEQVPRHDYALNSIESREALILFNSHR